MRDSKRYAAKTTIVGGQPPGNARDLPPVPLGLEQVLQLAAVSSEFETALLTDRKAAVEAAGIALTASEQGMLGAVDDATLRSMITRMDGTVTQPDRRAFLERAAGAVALLVGGAGLAACDDKKKPAKDKPLPKRKHEPPPQTTTGARVDRPEPPPAGIRPDRRPKPGPDAGPASPPRQVKPPTRRSNSIGGIRPRREKLPVDTGIRRRPDYQRAGTGIRPGTKDPLD